MLEIFGRTNCVWCERARELAATHNIPFSYRDFTKEQGVLAELRQRAPDAKTVPQIFIGNYRIGGYEQFAAYVKAGKLKRAQEAQQHGG